MTRNTSARDASENNTYLKEKDDDDICAICFEHRPFLKLPCSCNINYCGPCWDHALATSISTRGRAQCPSCRKGFDIDFDEDTASVVFSNREKGEGIAYFQKHVYREQAKPFQCRLLTRFGSLVKKNAGLRKVSEVSREVLRNEMLPAQEAEPCLPGCVSEPYCVCGGLLENIDTHTRIIRFLDDTRPDWRSQGNLEQQVESLSAHGVITCDLCDGIATITGNVWTCSRGRRTVLHPASVDICELCFSQHAGCGKVVQPCRIRTMLSDLNTLCEDLDEKKQAGKASNVQLSALSFSARLRQRFLPWRSQVRPMVS